MFEYKQVLLYEQVWRTTHESVNEIRIEFDFWSDASWWWDSTRIAHTLRMHTYFTTFFFSIPNKFFFHFISIANVVRRQGDKAN